MCHPVYSGEIIAFISGVRAIKLNNYDHLSEDRCQNFLRNILKPFDDPDKVSAYVVENDERAGGLHILELKVKV